MIDEINKMLLQLKFKGMAQKLDEIMADVQRAGASPETLLLQVLREEWRYRQERSMQYRITQAKLPWKWSIETFPFEQQPGVSPHQIRSLAGLDFIKRSENIVFIGPPGTGKSGLAMGLLRQALLNGYRGRFYNAQDMIDELYASLADQSTPRLLKRLTHYDLLVIDEIGYLNLKPEQVNAFFKLMEQRYHRKSTIITTNLEYDQWYELFQRKSLVDALLDRLRHRCITIRIDGPSLREPSEKQPSTESDDQNGVTPESSHSDPN